VATPRTSTPAGTVTWASGENFSGFLVVGIVVPVDGSAVAWPEVNFGNSLPSTRLPLWFIIPIKDSVYVSGIGVFYTADISPPNTRYAAYYYDLAMKQVAGPSTLFQATAPTFTVPPLTLTAPVAGTVAPTPDAPVYTTTQNVVYIPTIEAPAGTKNGSNPTFTVSRTPVALVLYKNGQKLAESTAYSLSGVTITFVAAYIPESGDIIEAMIW
jgi:hypothetical protein